jgi:flavin-dependent dehydrogenase
MGLDFGVDGAPITHGLLVSPGGVELLTELPKSIYGGRALVIPRSTLDERLVQRAVKAGAQLRQGLRVENVRIDSRGSRLFLNDGSTLDADVVIGCDGMPSVVRRCLGAPAFRSNQTASALRGIYDNVALEHENALMLLWERSVLPAYGWVFPLPGGRANVGIGLRMDQLKSGGRSLHRIHAEFLQLPRIRRVLANATPTGRAKGHPLPMTHSPGEFVFDRAVLAGDAAGFVNPLTGEGIEYALESGELAGRVIVMAAQLGSFSRRDLMPYAWACADQLGRVLRLNGLLRRVFAVPWLLDRIFRAGNRSRPLREDIARITLGSEDARFTPRMVLAAITG